MSAADSAVSGQMLIKPLESGNAVSLEGRRLRLLGWRRNCRRVPADDYPPWEKRSTLSRAPPGSALGPGTCGSGGSVGSRRAVSVADLPGVQPGDPGGWVGWLLLSAVGVVLFLRLEQARLYGPGPRYPLAHHGGRLLALTIAGVVLVLGSGILALCLIWHRLRTTAPADDWNWPRLASRQASCSGPGKGLPRSCSHSAWRLELSH